MAAEERVNRMEGEEEDSDLEITSWKDLGGTNKYIDDIAGASEGSTTEEDDEPERSGRPLMHNPPQYDVKVEWSDDEDAGVAYNLFKGRKSLKRKRAAAGQKKARARVTAASTKAIVGRRGRKPADPVDNVKPSLKKNNTYGTDSEDEDELMDQTLPEWLKARYSKKEREQLVDAGLNLPPDYEDVDFSDDERLEYLKEKPVLPHLKPPGKYRDIVLKKTGGIIPASIAQWLREYQVQGAEFLHNLFVLQKGGILGDDMGLGKTIQVIAFLTAAFGKTGDERDAKRLRKIRTTHPKAFYPRILIICPGGLMENWKSELERWGWWHVYIYHGAPDIKEATIKAALSGRVEIVITTYTTYRINKSAINTVDWDCVVADECHIIKGRSSEVTQAMNDINALCRIGLTGTAIQNKYEELWTLLNWSNPGRFGSLATWKMCISEPLKMGQAHDATYQQLAKARKTATSLVKNLLPAFFLRRMKTLIADQLPKKSDRVVFCPLTDTQADAYENIVNSDTIEYIRLSSEMCPCGSGKKRGWCCYTDIPGRGKWQNHVFPAIVLLQKLANHLAQLIPTSTDPQEKQAKDLENLQIAVPDRWKDLYQQKDSILHYANQDFCGKWKILKKLLTFWHAGGDKVLVFSHSVRLLKMLQMLFTSTTSYNVSYLDGAMSYEDRAKTVDSFNADPAQFVFLISTKAGGVGLNITSANKVVVVDPNWNPAYDLQAQDRAYRIGQTRDVEVFRLVSAGTIEEIVYARQIYKQQQANIGYNASLERRYFRGVQDQKQKKGEIFGLANLFSFQGDNIVLRDIVNKTNVAESKAGVKVVGFDASASQDDGEGDDPEDFIKGEDEHAAMSQLAKLVTADSSEKERKFRKGGGKKSDAVQAILASAGVQYTHENSEVIGTSKAETAFSRRAVEVENDVDMIGKAVFGGSQSQRFQKSSSAGVLDADADVDDESEEEGSQIAFKYRPPEEVRKRQFCTMAKTFGFADATEFALVVEGCTQAQRRTCLEKFYRARRQSLGLGRKTIPEE
ncbi:hypothetical protein H2201_006241 [Coniosporium apollinis]|uniref:DNA excision repair protein ERCC-6 n=1 Tax=Coniosporium apollinis TaxID=61459 RepID=A0ABQ9NNE8_9PEZI|nr:hypothetical protein H2201_006241 [Coniosporium apollinis]